MVPFHYQEFQISSVAEAPLLYVGHLNDEENARLTELLPQLEVGRFVARVMCSWSDNKTGIRLHVKPVAATLLAASLADGELRDFGPLFEARHGVEFQRRFLQVARLLSGKKVCITDNRGNGTSRGTNVLGICKAVHATPDFDSIDVELKNGSRYGLLVEKLHNNGVSGRFSSCHNSTRSVILA